MLKRFAIILFILVIFAPLAHAQRKDTGIGVIIGEPIDIFFEITPILELSPKTDFTLNAAVGFRFFF